MNPLAAELLAAKQGDPAFAELKWKVLTGVVVDASNVPPLISCDGSGTGVATPCLSTYNAVDGDPVIVLSTRGTRVCVGAVGAVTQPLCQMRMSAAQSITNNTITQLTFNTTDLDPFGWYSTTSGEGRITPTIGGWYRAHVSFHWQSDSDYTRRLVSPRKNNSDFTSLAVGRHDSAVAGGSGSATFSTALINMNGTTDYLNLYAFQTNTSAAANTVDVYYLVELVQPN